MLHSEKKRNPESAPNRSKHVGKDTLKVIEMDEEISWHAVIASLNSQKTNDKWMHFVYLHYAATLKLQIQTSFHCCYKLKTPKSNDFDPFWAIFR